MEKEKMIPASEFCQSHHIEQGLLHSIHNYALVDLIVIEEELFISNNQLPKLEKLLRLHVDLGINFEGIDTILHLLVRLEEMQQELAVLQTRLFFYETK